jgi:hypothetical protein
MNKPRSHRSKEISAAIGALVVIVVLVVLISLNSKKTTNLASATQSSSKSSSTGSTSKSVASTASYTDGSYNATGSYTSPGGEESITIELTLQKGVVTATSAKSGANDDEAMAYQSQFIGGYKKLVVGKSINTIKLSRVSGSSLTSQGFNEAIAKIKKQAEA